jgi:flagellar biosynthesis protein FlhG
MSGNAASLEGEAAGRSEPPTTMNGDERMKDERPRIWAIGGGKGGTGKSLLAASVGIHLAEMGRRVVLVDGDLGAPNLHTFLGLDGRGPSLADVVRRTVSSLDEAAAATALPRLRVVSGSRNSLDVESLKHFQRTRLLRLLLEVRADVVIVDLGAGTSLGVLDFFAIADRGVLVVLPEPTSIENCYRFVQAAFLRRLQRLAAALGYRPIVDLVLEHRGRARAGRPAEILEEIRRIDSSAAADLSAQMEEFAPRLVVNQARDHEDTRLGTAIEEASRRFLGIPIGFAGAVPYDPALVRSVKSRRAYLLEYPRSRTSEAFRAAGEAIAEKSRPRLDPRASRNPDHHPPGGATDPYLALDLAPGASPEQVLAAYLRLRPVFRADSPALHSLDCEADRRAALREIEEAYRTLSRNVSAGAGWNAPRPSAAGTRAFFARPASETAAERRRLPRPLLARPLPAL